MGGTCRSRQTANFVDDIQSEPECVDKQDATLDEKHNLLSSMLWPAWDRCSSRIDCLWIHHTLLKRSGPQNKQKRRTYSCRTICLTECAGNKVQPVFCDTDARVLDAEPGVTLIALPTKLVMTERITDQLIRDIRLHVVRRTPSVVTNKAQLHDTVHRHPIKNTECRQ